METTGKSSKLMNQQRPINPNKNQRQEPETKPEGGNYKSEYATISANSTTNENSALQRLNQLQRAEKKTWKGIKAEYVGRPGTCTLLNKKRFFPVSEMQKEHDHQNKLFVTIFDKLAELEGKKKKNQVEGGKTGALSPTSTATNTSSTSGNVNVNNSYGGKSAGSKSAPAKAYQEFIQFKTIKDHQVVSGPPSSHLYTRGGPNDYAELSYKLLKCEARLLRSTLECMGFSYTESHDWNIMWLACAGKPYLYDGLNEFQKINHYPSSYEITRKDKLCLNVLKMQEKFGKRNYYIIPDTYLLPDEFADFFAEFHQVKSSEGRKPLWIIKPNASSQGKGIYLIDDINDIDLDESCVVSKYIPNPLLINGHKFDLRIYVLVTSFDPLRVYVYKEGLTRFATEEYTTSTNKKSRFIHLTNYSLNKKNPNWRTNEESDRDDFGFKWSITALCKHLEQIGIDMNLLWSKVYDVIIKALICGEHPIISAMRRNCSHRTNCFELLGFDVLLDSDLKPWLLEINLSPSLSADSPLDFTIKTNVITDTLNLVGIMKFDRRRESMNKMKNRMKGVYKGKNGYTAKTGGANLKGLFTDDTEDGIKLGSISKEMEMMIKDIDCDDESKELMMKMAKLKNKELIREIVTEYERRGNFVRIFPAPGCNEYEKYFQHQKTINRYLHKVLFGDDLISKQEIDLKTSYKLNYDVPKLSSYKEVREETKQKTKSTAGASDASTADESRLPQIGAKASEPSKVVITGDDVLIEYVARLIKRVGIDPILEDPQAEAVESFVTHYVWHNDDVAGASTHDRLKNRLSEMILRRKKLLKSMCKKELMVANTSGKEASNRVASMIQEREQQKESLLVTFKVDYLEEMLKSTTKSIARDVVSTLIPSDKCGVLLSIEKSLKRIKSMNDDEEEKKQDDTEKEAKQVSSEIQRFIVHSKLLENVENSDPYKLTGINSGGKSSSSSVKFPPAAQKSKARERSSSSSKHDSFKR